MKSYFWNEINKRIATEWVICEACSGSGEGQRDGSTCRSCGGDGEVLVEVADTDEEELK